MTQHGFHALTAAAAIAMAAGTALAQQPAAPKPAAPQPAAPQAEAPASYKIGFVSSERVMRESRAVQQMQKVMDAEFNKRTKEIEAGPPADIERRKAALNEDLTLKRDDLLRQFIDKSNGIIRRVAEAEKFDAVFMEAAYFNKRIDITDRIIKAIDSER